MRNSVRALRNILLVASLMAAARGEAQFVLGSVEAGQGKGFARHAPSNSTGSAAGARAYQILHYRIDLRLPLTTEALSGRVTAAILLTAATDTLQLNAAFLSLDTVEVNGVHTPIRVDSAGQQFTVLLGTTRDSGDTLLLTIGYHRLTGVSRPAGRIGYYWFTPSTSPLALDTLGYTMSEPSDARFWLPCLDDPSEKSTAEIHATVPAGFVAASNGRLVGVTPNSDGTVTWHWVESHPVATYLICVTASKFTRSTLPFARAAGDTIPLQYYVWPADSAACAAYLPTVQQMVANLSALFRPYPFDKYGMTGVSPFGFGGMEHQSLTTLGRSYVTNRGVVVHELAHQWWGDAVTCGTWKDIWLNESFATYAEALWEESVGGASALRAKMTAKLSFNSSWNYAVYDPVGQGQYIFSDLVYSKGGWILHTLRGIVGDSLFFGALRDYYDLYQGKSALSDDLQAVFEQKAGSSLSWFFDPWVHGPGWPVYAYSWSFSADSLSVRIHQLQDAAWPTYRMPVQFRATKGQADTTFVLLDSLREQSFRIPFPFAPDSVAFDPDSWILKQMSAGPTIAEREGNSIPESFLLDQNYPNPFNPSTRIRYSIPGSRDQGSGVNEVRLVVYDLLGREVAVLVDEKQAPGSYQVRFNAAGLTSGVYLYRLTVGSFVQTNKMVLMK